jgi:hypothetical protein
MINATEPEKATFTGALYAKQVDTLANLQGKANTLSNLVLPYVLEYNRVAVGLGELGYTPNPLLSHAVEISGSADELVSAAFAAQIVYPTEAKAFFQQIVENGTKIEWTLHTGRYLQQW